jgi:hypothetical protein
MGGWTKAVTALRGEKGQAGTIGGWGKLALAEFPFPAKIGL